MTRDREFDARIANVLDAEARLGRMNRRRFLASAAALGVTANMASGIWSKARASTPQQGGHAIFGITDFSTGDSLDPTLQSTDHVNFMRNALRNTLIELRPDGTLAPDLAESWESSDDLMTWTFDLRQGVEFHNGKSLDAQDVIDSLNLHRGEDTKSGGKALLSAIDDIRADGANRVVITLGGGNADFPYYLTQFFFLIVPSADGVPDTTSGVGTGPFVLDSYEPGVRGVARRNPNYHRDGLPYFDSVEAVAIQDPAARVSALVTGEVHVIDKLDAKTVPMLGRSGDVDIVSVTSGTHYTMPMNTTVAPFDDVNVRVALKHLMNRDSLVDTVLNGYATPANDHPISPTDPFFHAELPLRAYDPEKAKYHLDQAGVSGLEIDLHGSDGVIAGAIDACVLFQQSAAEAGVTVNVRREPADGYWSNIWRNVPFCFAYWNGRPTADLMFTTAYYSEAAWNDSSWANAQFDELLLAARKEADTGTRRQMYWDMQEIVHEDGGVVVPAYVDYLYGFSDKIGHDRISGTRWWDEMRAAERWWFKT